MNAITIISLFFILVFLFIFLLRKKKDIDLKDIFICFSFSISALFLSIIIQNIIYLLVKNTFIENNYIFYSFFNSFISSSLIEENAKIFCFFIASKFLLKKESFNANNKVYSEKLFFLAIIYGLVFASFENLAYFIQDIESIKIRILTSSLLHSTISLYYWKIITKKNKSLYFISAWLLHATYNLFLSTNIYLSILSVLIIFFLLIKSFDTYKEINKT